MCHICFRDNKLAVATANSPLIVNYSWNNIFYVFHILNVSKQDMFGWFPPRNNNMEQNIWYIFAEQDPQNQAWQMV